MKFDFEDKEHEKCDCFLQNYYTKSINNEQKNTNVFYKYDKVIRVE